MILPSHETERFYRIWWALLQYTNAQRHLVPNLPAQMGERALAPSKVHKIRQAIWKDDALRETFIAENPAGLPPEDLAIVASWRSHVAGNFFIMRYLKKYTVFLREGTPPRAYGVLGLVSPLEEVIGPYLPVYVEAVLLPFEGRIIYDSLLAPYNVFFGSGIREDLNKTYRDAREREGIITCMLPLTESSSADDTRKPIQVRNAKILSAFRKALFKSGLSPKMVEKHVSNIEIFASVYLLAQTPPRQALDIQTEDVEVYLGRGTSGAAEEKANVSSFKRFIRFLYNSERIDPPTARALQEVMKSYQRGEPQ